MSETDLQLLRQYAEQRAEDAFAEIVRRHLNLVYSAALRQVRSPQLAEEIAQSVFADLARNAGRLRPDTIVAAWLHEVTRRTAIDVVRRESRRQAREQIASELNAMNATSVDWTRIEPLLDEAVAALDESDRAAVLLRYFESKSLREVGDQLGVSDDAAQKRVSRAVDRLREFFSRRGVNAGAAGLMVVISANAVQAAPAGLAAAISTAAVAGTAVSAAAVAVSAKTIAMTTIQKSLIAVTIAVLAGAGIYEARRAGEWRDQARTFQRQQAPLAEQIQQLQAGLAGATNQLAELIAENARLSSNPNQNELLNLRREVTQLRARLEESAHSSRPATDSDLPAEKELLDKVKQLKALAVRMPEKTIPEFSLLTERDWLELASRAPVLDTETGSLQALFSLRLTSKQYLAAALSRAVGAFANDHNGELPTDLGQLRPYFSTPISDSILQRYRLVATGNIKDLAENQFVIEEAAAADPNFDTVIHINLKGAVSQNVGSREFIQKTFGKPSATPAATKPPAQ